MTATYTVIRRVADRALFVGFKYIAFGNVEAKWSRIDEGSQSALVFTAGVPEETLRDIAKSCPGPEHRFIEVPLKEVL